MAESKEELKSLLMKVKEESKKSDLKPLKFKFLWIEEKVEGKIYISKDFSRRE